MGRRVAYSVAQKRQQLKELRERKRAAAAARAAKEKADREAAYVATAAGARDIDAAAAVEAAQSAAATAQAASDAKLALTSTAFMATRATAATDDASAAESEIASDGDKPVVAGATASAIQGKRQVQLNSATTVFARENDAVVEQRRVLSDAPLERTAASECELPVAHRSWKDPEGLTDHPRPPSTAATDEEQQAAFAMWLQALYAKYPRSMVNHFEHNVKVWQQLWHALLAADTVAVLADVRNPLYHIHQSLYDHVMSLGKSLVIVLTKVCEQYASFLVSWAALTCRPPRCDTP